MFFSQKIKVNLTAERSDVLRKPSKLFNKLRAAISGGMTPTEAAQAEVMVCVLQRLNTACRAAGMTDMRKILANGTVVFEQHYGSNNCMDATVEDLCEQLQEGDFKPLQSLELFSEMDSKELNFAVVIHLVRKPKAGHAHIEIDITGLVAKLKKRHTDGAGKFETRIEAAARRDFVHIPSLLNKAEQYEAVFKEKVEQLLAEIKLKFPAFGYKKALIKRIASRKKLGSVAVADSCYDKEAAYLPIYFNMSSELYGGNNHSPNRQDHEDFGEWLAEGSDVVECLTEALCSSASPDTTTTSTSSSSTGSSSSFSDFFSFDSGSSGGGSSCGSSCGGGCGGGD